MMLKEAKEQCDYLIVGLQTIPPLGGLTLLHMKIITYRILGLIAQELHIQLKPCLTLVNIISLHRNPRVRASPRLYLNRL